MEGPLSESFTLGSSMNRPAHWGIAAAVCAAMHAYACVRACALFFILSLSRALPWPPNRAVAMPRKGGANKRNNDAGEPARTLTSLLACRAERAEELVLHFSPAASVLLPQWGRRGRRRAQEKGAAGSSWAPAVVTRPPPLPSSPRRPWPPPLLPPRTSSSPSLPWPSPRG